VYGLGFLLSSANGVEQIGSVGRHREPLPCWWTRGSGYHFTFPQPAHPVPEHPLQELHPLHEPPETSSSCSSSSSTSNSFLVSPFCLSAMIVPLGIRFDSLLSSSNGVEPGRQSRTSPPESGTAARVVSGAERKLSSRGTWLGRSTSSGSRVAEDEDAVIVELL